MVREDTNHGVDEVLREDTNYGVGEVVREDMNYEVGEVIREDMNHRTGFLWSDGRWQYACSYCSNYSPFRISYSILIHRLKVPLLHNVLFR